jgi:hypothetical protein
VSAGFVRLGGFRLADCPSAGSARSKRAITVPE